MASPDAPAHVVENGLAYHDVDKERTGPERVLGGDLRRTVGLVKGTLVCWWYCLI